MILITSANGNQGKRLVPKLLASGHHVRACVRTEASAEQLRALGAQQVLVGDLADPAFIAQAMKGVASVYHIGPTLHHNERAMGFAMIDAARAEGVGHFVFSSVLHAIASDLIQHEIKRDIEEHLLSSGLEYTILQPGNYMLPSRMKAVFEEGVFRLAWSLDRRQSMVDLEDFTDVVALVLSDRERHAAATYELVGPGRFTAYEIGAVASKVIGREIRVERFDVEVFVRERFGNLDPEALQHMLRMNLAIATYYSNHDFVGNSSVLSFLLGRPATTFDEFVRREYASVREDLKTLSD
ncbi:SDR family oxidoreductase [Pseudomonas sp. PAMC 29040]|uniref:SDR family oxidoreductase n=1 Tax=Pseudomonas sp. PAMC 29040 TaxID=2498450 RepID=UPI002115BE2F|nr:NmrA family NAD(P)-binding protein [Pseudomonas sp. PAMC 29040]